MVWPGSSEQVRVASATAEKRKTSFYIVLVTGGLLLMSKRQTF
jgi:hypothetical protein